MAALGILAAFFMALIALLLAPTLASAEKNSGSGYPHAGQSAGNGAPNPVYSEHGRESDRVTWNAPPHGPCDAPSCGRQDNPQHPEDALSGDGGYFSDYEQDNHGQNGGSSPGSNGGGANGGFPDGRFAHGGGGGSSGGSPGGFFSHQDNSDSDNSGTHDGDHGEDHDGDHDGDHDKPRFDVPKTSLAPPDDPYHDPDPDTGPPTFGPPPGDKVPQEPGPGLDATTEVPEPLTLSLFMVGLAGVAAIRRRAKVK